MAYEIVHTRSAGLDFDGIIHYITFRLNNPMAAYNLRDEYQSRLATLRESPRFYRPAYIEKFSRKGYHQFTFGNSTAFYNIDDEAKTVYIVRIFYKKQDYESIL